MRKILGTLLILITVFSFGQDSGEIDEFREDIKKNKTQAKNALGNYNYDGSKITYYITKSTAQNKEVEVEAESSPE